MGSQLELDLAALTGGEVRCCAWRHVGHAQHCRRRPAGEWLPRCPSCKQPRPGARSGCAECAAYAARGRA